MTEMILLSVGLSSMTVQCDGSLCRILSPRLGLVRTFRWSCWMLEVVLVLVLWEVCVLGSVGRFRSTSLGSRRCLWVLYSRFLFDNFLQQGSTLEGTKRR